MMARRLIRWVLAVTFLAGGVAFAQAGDLAGARQFVVNLSDRAIQVMTGKGIPDAQRTEQFRRLFIGAVDMATVDKLVLGRYWRIATPEERTRFQKLFEDIVVYSWANRFKNTAGSVQLQISDVVPGVGGRVRVNSEIVRQGRESVAVVWHLRPVAGGWRIFDLGVAGTSMVATYRSEYAEYLSSHGGSVTALNQALAQKVSQLSQPGAGGG